jgi:hypothetical protein
MFASIGIALQKINSDHRIISRNSIFTKVFPSTYNPIVVLILKINH